VDATIEAAHKIADRQYTMNENDKFDHMLKMKEHEEVNFDLVSKLKHNTSQQIRREQAVKY
jgi:hypothetical protein